MYAVRFQLTVVINWLAWWHYILRDRTQSWSHTLTDSCIWLMAMLAPASTWYLSTSVVFNRYFTWLCTCTVTKHRHHHSLLVRQHLSHLSHFHKTQCCQLAFHISMQLVNSMFTVAVNSRHASDSSKTDLNLIEVREHAWTSFQDKHDQQQERILHTGTHALSSTSSASFNGKGNDKVVKHGYFQSHSYINHR